MPTKSASGRPCVISLLPLRLARPISMFWIPISLAALATPALVQNSSMTEVTIYNQGFGFIKEVRELPLKAGRQEVRVEDVAQRIEPNSVAIRSLNFPNDLSVLEQNYQFDLISRQAILAKSVGGKVIFHRLLGNGQKESLRGTLISSPTAIVNSPNGGSQMQYNGMVIRTDDNRILLDPTGEVEVERMPEGLISTPTLMWDLESAKAATHKVELSYLTQGMSWECDYVMTLDDKAKTADLRGWVTLNNQSGATFTNARLKLLAGDVERAQPQVAEMKMKSSRGAAPGGGGFQQEALFEYHLYTLQRPATVRNNEMKQVSLLEAGAVPYRKKLIVDAMQMFGQYFPSEGEVGTGDIKPQVRIEFTNDEKSNLGMPLPKGTVKVYQRDASGSVQMLGEDEVDHTPNEEKLSLAIGRSFDVRATRKRTNFRRLSDRAFEEQFEIEVRNRKEVAETVSVYERPWGDWKVTTTDKYEKLNSNLIEFVVNLAAGETKTVRYTLVTRW
jgi:hypothetical protein